MHRRLQGIDTHAAIVAESTMRYVGDLLDNAFRIHDMTSESDLSAIDLPERLKDVEAPSDLTRPSPFPHPSGRQCAPYVRFFLGKTQFEKGILPQWALCGAEIGPHHHHHHH